jgi:hypothetical protein
MLPVEMKRPSAIREAFPSDQAAQGSRFRRTYALPPKADMCGALAHVCFGPKADIEPIYTNAATRGRITLISVNSPGCESTSIEPPCCLTMMS